MNVSTRFVGQTAVVEVRGVVDRHTCLGLRAALLELIHQGRPRIVIALEDVETMDSSGLSVVIQAWKETKAHGGILRLASPPDSVRRVLEVTGVERLLPVCDSLEEACRFPE